MKLHKTERDVALSKEAFKMSEPLIGTGVTVTFGGSKGPFRVTVDYLEKDKLVSLVEVILAALGEEAKPPGPPDEPETIDGMTPAELRLERDAARDAYEMISQTESSIREKNHRLTRDNCELQNIIAVHEETIRTQSKLIASLRESIADVRRANGYLNDKLEEKTAEHKAFADAALSGLSAFGCTPEKGYAKDGGVGLLVVDFQRARKKVASLHEQNARLIEDNMKLINRLSSFAVASRELIANVEPRFWAPEHAVVRLSDVNVLRMLVHTSPSESTEADQPTGMVASEAPKQTWDGVTMRDRIERDREVQS